MAAATADAATLAVAEEGDAGRLAARLAACTVAAARVDATEVVVARGRPAASRVDATGAGVVVVVDVVIGWATLVGAPVVVGGEDQMGAAWAVAEEMGIH